jgi:hypothetical protein
MSRTRRAALEISSGVTWRASPGCKEWAEGLEREVEFVEGDWRALGWAIGSLRVLLRNPPKPLRNAEEIARAGRLFAGSREHVPPMFFLLMAMQVFNNVLGLVFRWGRIGHLQRAGFAIAALSAAYMAVVGWLVDFRMGQRPKDMDDGAWIEFYRREMVRLRDLYTGFGGLLPTALVLFGTGSLLSLEGVARPFLTSCLIALVGFICWLGVRPGENFQRKVDNLDLILQQGCVRD